MLQCNFKNRTSEPWGYFLIIYFYLLCKDYFRLYCFFIYINTLGRETNSMFMKNFDGDQLVTVLRLYCFKDGQYPPFYYFYNWKKTTDSHYTQWKLNSSLHRNNKALKNNFLVHFAQRGFVTKNLQYCKQRHLHGWHMPQFRI